MFSKFASAVDASSDDGEPNPVRELALRLIPTRNDANVHGDRTAGWVVAQMDHAAEGMAARVAKGSIASVSLESVVFMSPIRVGATVGFDTNLLEIGTSSLRIASEVSTRNPNENGRRKLVDALFVYVAIDEAGRIRKVPH